MQGKVKLSIPIGLLMAVTCGVAPSLEKISVSSWPFGGGINFLKNLGRDRVDSQSLELEDKSIHLAGNKNYSEKTVSQLQTKTEDFSSLEALKTQLQTNKSQQDVTTIYSEVKKETEAQKIDKHSQSKVVLSRSKFQKTDFQNFRTALAKIQKFKNPSSQLLPRSTRSPKSTPSSHIEKLSDAEKKSIKDFFQQYQNLDREKSQLSGNLSNAVGEKPIESLQQKMCLSCIASNLDKIGWLGKDLNLFDKRSTYRSNPINRHIYYSSTSAPNKEKAQQTWGNWLESSHPYYYFFDSEDKWLASVNRISEFWKSYYKYVNNRVRTFTSLITLGFSGSADKGSLERGIDDSKASLELEIGTKLMSIMSRLS